VRKPTSGLESPPHDKRKRVAALREAGNVTGAATIVAAASGLELGTFSSAPNIT
jgi:hypothetical protein